MYVELNKNDILDNILAWYFQRALRMYLYDIEIQNWKKYIGTKNSYLKKKKICQISKFLNFDS